MVCLWYVYSMFMVCLWYVYGMFINTGDIRKRTTRRLYQAHGGVTVEEYDVVLAGGHEVGTLIMM